MLSGKDAVASPAGNLDSTSPIDRLPPVTVHKPPPPLDQDECVKAENEIARIVHTCRVSLVENTEDHDDYTGVEWSQAICRITLGSLRMPVSWHCKSHLLIQMHYSLCIYS